MIAEERHERQVIGTVSTTQQERVQHLLSVCRGERANDPGDIIDAQPQIPQAPGIPGFLLQTRSKHR